MFTYNNNEYKFIKRNNDLFLYEKQSDNEWLSIYRTGFDNTELKDNEELIHNIAYDISEISHIINDFDLVAEHLEKLF